MSIEDHPKARFNLSKASVLLLDSTAMGLSVLAQITKGFGAQQVYKCSTAQEAKEVARNHSLHLSIVDALSPVDGGYGFVQWMRREAPEPNRFSPIILIEGHTRAADVAKARDSGANFMVKRPISPLQLMERIIWIGSEDRTFVTGATYAGPDRRFQNIGPPATGGRRRNDPKTAVLEPPGDGHQAQSSQTDTST